MVAVVVVVVVVVIVVVVVVKLLLVILVMVPLLVVVVVVLAVLVVVAFKTGREAAPPCLRCSSQNANPPDTDARMGTGTPTGSSAAALTNMASPQWGGGVH